jgi:hypothetical protein
MEDDVHAGERRVEADRVPDVADDEVHPRIDLRPARMDRREQRVEHPDVSSASSSTSTRWEPMNPAPPVTRTRMNATLWPRQAGGSYETRKPFATTLVKK